MDCCDQFRIVVVGENFNFTCVALMLHQFLFTMTFVVAGRSSVSKIGWVATRNSWLQAARKATTKTDPAKTKSKMTWSRGYLGVGSDTKAPDATFMAGKFPEFQFRLLIQAIY